ncbi:MAG: hypothetical protein KAH86_07535 [Methanosarcinales archaeon]|nr:hypothetical protein [Methanosarcinales archaeon]
MAPSPFPQAGACTDIGIITVCPELTGYSPDQEEESKRMAQIPLYIKLLFEIETETVVLSPVYMEGGFGIVPREYDMAPSAVPDKANVIIRVINIFFRIIYY